MIVNSQRQLSSCWYFWLVGWLVSWLVCLVGLVGWLVRDWVSKACIGLKDSLAHMLSILSNFKEFYSKDCAGFFEVEHEFSKKLVPAVISPF